RVQDRLRSLRGRPACRRIRGLRHRLSDRSVGTDDVGASGRRAGARRREPALHGRDRRACLSRHVRAGSAMSNDVREVMRSVYGEELGAVEGVLHVVAVHEQDGERRVIRIGEHSPRSATDRFALDLARTRVEAILVTGAILREEPELRYELPLELERYRREALGLKDPPWLLVLTRGDVSLDHPALGGWARPIVLTSERAAEALPTRAEVEIVGVPEPSARAALAYLRDERGCRAISIEAGPKTAVPL